MSGLCGIAIAHAAAQEATEASDSHAIGEVLITDGNVACINEGVKHQIAWNEALQTAESKSHWPKVDAAVLQWDRNADYSKLGRFDAIFVADW